MKHIYLFILILFNLSGYSQNFNKYKTLNLTFSVDNYRIHSEGLEGILVNSLSVGYNFHLNPKIATGLFMSPTIYHTSTISDAEFKGGMLTYGIQSQINFYETEFSTIYTRFMAGRTYHEMRKKSPNAEKFHQKGTGWNYGLDFGFSYIITDEYGIKKPYAFFAELGAHYVKHSLSLNTTEHNGILNNTSANNVMAENPYAFNFNISMGVLFYIGKEDLDSN